MGRRPKEFALYSGDTFLDIGTLDELAEKYNRSRKNLEWAAHCKRWKNTDHSRKGFVLVALEDEEND